MKKCSKCGEVKPLNSDSFEKRCDSKDGFRGVCRCCRKVIIDKKNLKLKDKRSNNEDFKVAEKEYQQNYRKTDKSKLRAKKYRESPKGKEVYSNYLYNLTDQQKKDYQKYKKTDKYKAKRRLQVSKRYKADSNFKIKNVLCGRIRSAIKNQNTQKQEHSASLLGATIEEVRIHLSKRFTEGMSWDNHGEWHIDHIKPCASFDLTDTRQQKECFHYTNLQPLWAEDNLRKSDKLNWKKEA